MARAREETPEHPTRCAAHRAVLTVSLLFVLAAVSISTGLVVYTAWLHDLQNGPFALLFAILSTRATLSWFRWHEGDHPSTTSHQEREGRKPADEAIQ